MSMKSKMERLLKKKADKDARQVADVARQVENGADVPAKVNNFLVGSPRVAVPNNTWLDKICQTRILVDNIPVVNGQVADDSLIHPPVFEDVNQKFVPTIDPNVVKKSKPLKNKGV